MYTDTLVISIYDGGFCSSALFVGKNENVVLHDGYDQGISNPDHFLYDFDDLNDKTVKIIFNAYPFLREIIVCEDGYIRTYYR